MAEGLCLNPHTVGIAHPTLEHESSQRLAEAHCWAQLVYYKVVDDLRDNGNSRLVAEYCGQEWASA